MSRRPLTPTHGHLDDHAHDSARRRNPQADARDRDGERHGSQLRPSGADALVRSICRETNLNILARHKMPDASLARCRLGHSLRRLVLASLCRLAINNREVLTPHGRGEFHSKFADYDNPAVRVEKPTCTKTSRYQSGQLHREPPHRIVLMATPQAELTIDEYLGKR